MSPTALAAGDSAAKEPTQDGYATARKPGPNDSRGRFYGPRGNTSIKEGYKELVISPGKLGLTLQFMNDTKGATICKINPLCNFQDDVKINDRIVSIDGLLITNSSQLQIGIGHTRIFGIERDIPGNSLKWKDDKAILNEFDKKRKHEQQRVEETETQKKKPKPAILMLAKRSFLDMELIRKRTSMHKRNKLRRLQLNQLVQLLE